MAPKPAVWQFLQEHIPAALMKPEVRSWEEIYWMIAPHGDMLQALLMPPNSQEAYYQGIINTALGLGFNDSALVFGLLWHAPHGEARQNPDKRDYLQTLADTALGRQAGGAPLPGLPARVSGAGRMNHPPVWRLPPRPPSRPKMSWICFPGSQPPDPGRDDREAAPVPNFEPSVSGQFFQLLAGLGEKVIMESCRYEAMLTGVRHQAGEIDNLVSQWEQYFAGSSPTSRIRAKSLRDPP